MSKYKDSLSVLVPRQDDTDLVRFLIDLDSTLESVYEDEETKAAGLWQGDMLPLKRVLLQEWVGWLRLYGQ